MREYKKVRGTQNVMPGEIEVNVDTVYIRSNVQPVKSDDFSGWEYDEKQYDIKEYIAFIGEKNTHLEFSNELSMMALTEMYEENLKLSNENSSTMLAVTELYEMLMGGMV